jgi:hypothetical protein
VGVGFDAAVGGGAGEVAGSWARLDPGRKAMAILREIAEGKKYRNVDL